MVVFFRPRRSKKLNPMILKQRYRDNQGVGLMVDDDETVSIETPHILIKNFINMEQIINICTKTGNVRKMGLYCKGSTETTLYVSYVYGEEAKIACQNINNERIQGTFNTYVLAQSYYGEIPHNLSIIMEEELPDQYHQEPDDFLLSWEPMLPKSTIILKRTKREREKRLRPIYITGEEQDKHVMQKKRIGDL
mmetsp:Transcript_3051/g.4480  ORF Transcript_3051/g.4480 Transcript_3051/m.4480 type:complete len:193 (-) Transcript_3051:74-652(-)